MKTLKEHLIEESGVSEVQYRAIVTVQNEWSTSGTGEYAFLNDSQINAVEARIRVETRHEERMNRMALPDAPEITRLKATIELLQDQNANYLATLGDLGEIKGELKEARANNERLQAQNNALAGFVSASDNLRRALDGYSLVAIKNGIAEYDVARAKMTTREQQ